MSFLNLELASGSNSLSPDCCRLSLMDWSALEEEVIDEQRRSAQPGPVSPLLTPTNVKKTAQQGSPFQPPSAPAPRTLSGLFSQVAAAGGHTKNTTSLKEEVEEELQQAQVLKKPAGKPGAEEQKGCQGKALKAAAHAKAKSEPKKEQSSSQGLAKAKAKSKAKAKAQPKAVAQGPSASTQQRGGVKRKPSMMKKPSAAGTAPEREEEDEIVYGPFEAEKADLDEAAADKAAMANADEAAEDEAVSRDEAAAEDDGKAQDDQGRFQPPADLRLQGPWLGLQ